ncbi:IclR family transcriptional regulator [Pseudorhodoplanes sp.]|uniref:IclR family transcriptional regulator n=1 Tax=Pseudorhodoplanes sp. TaxID=1934341 RepID=UPI003D0C0A28
MYLLGKRNGYFPTPRLRALGESILRGDPIVMLAQSHVRALRDAIGETAVFGKRDGTEALYLEVQEADHAVRFVAHAGQRKMMHSGASGKALMALMAPDERREFIGQLNRPAISQKTLVTVEDIERAIDRGIRVGWHVAIGENSPDLTSIAAGFGVGGEGYFFCVGGPTSRISSRKEEIGKVVAQLAATIEREAS